MKINLMEVKKEFESNLRTKSVREVVKDAARKLKLRVDQKLIDLWIKVYGMDDDKVSDGK